MRSDARDDISVLSPVEYCATWERYRERNAAAQRVPRPEQVLAWHTREAIQAEAARLWRTSTWKLC
jgi:hypothetical protein